MNFESCLFLHDLNGLDGVDHLEILKSMGGFEGEPEGFFGESGREVSDEECQLFVLLLVHTSSLSPGTCQRSVRIGNT